jgi:hypothetical protein
MNDNKGGRLAGGAGELGRVKDDFYATDRESVRDLFRNYDFGAFCVKELDDYSFLEPCCVDENTQYFNGQNWEYLKNYIDDKVLCLDEHGTARMTTPSKYHVVKDQKFTIFNDSYLSMAMTQDHDVVYIEDGKYKKIKYKKAMERYVSDSNGFRKKIPTAFKMSGEDLHLSDSMIMLIVAVNADARVRSSTNNTCIRVKKNRKYLRLKSILKQCGMNYRYKFTDNRHQFDFYMDKNYKTFPKEFMFMSYRQKMVFINELPYWDGEISNNGRTKRYYTSKSQDFEIVQFMIHSAGVSSNVREDNRTGLTNYCVSILRKESSAMKKNVHRAVNKITYSKGTAYCFTVDTGMLVLRRNNKIFITGNCGQGHIADVIKEYFPDSEITGCDIVDRGWEGTRVINYLKDYLMEYGKMRPQRFDWVITNPPFKHAKEFIEKALFQTDKGVAMFLKIQFLEGQARKEWLKNSPLKYVYVFSKRQDPLRDGMELNPKTGKKWGSTMCFAWFIWEHGYTGEPVVRWI